MTNLSLSKRKLIAILVIACSIVATVSGVAAYYFMRQPTSQNTVSTVSLDVVPDWAGSGIDAFVKSSSVPGSTPTAPADTNFVVKANTPINFVLTNVDTAVNQNYTGVAPNTYTVYTDNGDHVVATTYQSGQQINALASTHSFTMDNPKINVMIPPGSIVTFTYTFTSTGTFHYYCLMPCGLGMGRNGLMVGTITVV